ncbi:MAG: hypothetical protein HZC41_04590 [Chloroflexi bacterium]|nr:hypothetical protein [Chloroflexota bacterium]
MFKLLVAIVIAVVAGCSPAPQSSVETLPTLAVLNPVPTAPPENAERVARAFLEAWKADDLPVMYSLITFNSQEATPLDTFTALYQSSHTEMTLHSLDYDPITMYRERDNIVVFAYDITFNTNLLGQFTDKDRQLRLVMDERAGDWRVAWSPGDIFAEMGSGGRLRLEISAPSRANIYDRNGDILADQNGKAVIVRAIKQEIPSWETCLPLLVPLLGKTAEDIQRIYDESAPNWLMEFGTMEASAYEQSHATLEQACAAQFASRPTRRYQNGTLAPYILGNIGYPDEADIPAVEAAGFTQDSILGKSGIEKSWDDTLRGRPGGRLLIVSQGGGVLREIARNPSKAPESVWLTLDAKLQAGVAKIIADAYAKNAWSKTSKGAAAVVMNVHTGEILAMVSYPTYDGNAFSPFPTIGRAEAARIVAEVQTDPRRPQLNRAVNGLYPLGSVMKTVSATAVSDSGVYALDEKYTCVGRWTRDITRYDWNSGHGTLTLPGALTQSCNPYFYEVGYQMFMHQPGLLPEYMRRLGFGSPTGLRDLDESAGFIPSPEWKRQNMGYDWNFSDEVNISIGQGEVQVTPLQVTRWFAAIANRGDLLRPQLVKQVGILGEAPSYTLQPDVMGNIGVKPEEYDMLREGLCAVTQSRAGTAEYQFRLDPDLQNVGVCGKTGTAQDGSSPDAVSHAWFAAFAPMDNPEIAVAVIVENSGEGSGVAAPLVRDILHLYFFGELPAS